MRKYLFAGLLFLIACIPQQPPAPTAPNLTLATVLDEFSKLDAQYNTSWRGERLPGNMIQPDAIEPWTAGMLFLRGRVVAVNDSLLLDVVDARIEMLKAQVGFYLARETGERGHVNMTREGIKLVVLEKIDCNDAPVIFKTTRLYNQSLTAGQKFVSLMDRVLERSEEAKALIGVNERRPEFYNSRLGDLWEQIDVTKKAVFDQCGIVQKES